MYKQCKPIFDGAESSSVLKMQGGVAIACIPFDPQNVDYQAYLKWVAQGNSPLPADEVKQ
jgi:hypothetical protein